MYCCANCQTLNEDSTVTTIHVKPCQVPCLTPPYLPPHVSGEGLPSTPIEGPRNSQAGIQFPPCSLPQKSIKCAGG